MGKDAKKDEGNHGQAANPNGQDKQNEEGDRNNTQHNDTLIDWLTSEMNFWDTNHNHKEKMAWAATAFYLPAILVFSESVAKYLPSWAAIPSIVILFVVALIFVDMQFERRWIAAEVFKQLREVRRRSVLGSDNLYPFTEPATKWETLAMKQEGGKLRSLRNWRAARSRSEMSSYLALLIVTLVGIVRVWCPSGQLFL